MLNLQVALGELNPLYPWQVAVAQQLEELAPTASSESLPRSDESNCLVFSSLSISLPILMSNQVHKVVLITHSLMLTFFARSPSNAPFCVLFRHIY